MPKPLISVIVPTYNSTQFLEACLKSITDQTYKNIELIVVDNNSKDDTKEIAKRYTDKVYNRGPERSAQRNYGVSQSAGDYVLIIDSDMELGAKVVEQCVEQFTQHAELLGLVIPEESFGEGFWAQCKRLERSFYIGVPWMEAARAFRRKAYLDVGGYNEDMVSGEDWDLSQRVEAIGKLGRVAEFIRHNEGRLKLGTTLRKKYYYAQKFAAYSASSANKRNIGSQTGLFTRYKLYFSKPAKLISHPLIGVGMLFMKTIELAFGGTGYLLSGFRGDAA